MEESGRPRRQPGSGLRAPLVLPAGFACFLVIGAAAAAAHGSLPGAWVAGLVAAVTGAGAALGDLVAAPVLAVTGWLTVLSFSAAPYGQVHPATRLAGLAAVATGGCAAAGLAAGLARRALTGRGSARDAEDLAGLAHAVRAGTGAVLACLTRRRGGQARLLRQAAGGWVQVAGAGAGPDPAGRAVQRAVVGAGLVLELSGQDRLLSPRLLSGLSAQVATAVELDRLRPGAGRGAASPARSALR